MAIIPAHEEEQLRLRSAEQTAQRAFNAQWEVDELPACPAGMALLKALADVHPAAFELARQSRFTDAPLLARNARWRAFAEHRTACPDCNESGAGARPYDAAYPPGYIPPAPTSLK